MSRNNRKLSHHKRAHNGRHRVRKGDIFQPRPTTLYRRPCGCCKQDVPRKNKVMVRVILSTRPEMRWDGNDWSLFIPQHLSKRFGRCLRHLTEDDKATLRERGLAVQTKGSEKMSNGKSASKSNPQGIRNTKNRQHADKEVLVNIQIRA